MTIETIGLSANQVAHAVCMYADDSLKDNLYALHEVLCNENVRENIISVDENIVCDDMFLDDMVNFVKSLNAVPAEKGRQWNVYVLTDEWSSRETIRIEGIIAFAD